MSRGTPKEALDPPLYSLEPLAYAMREPLGRLCVVLGISGQAWKRYRTEGVSDRVAENLATKAGFHPYEIWPEMAERRAVEAAEAEERRREQRRASQRRYAAKRRQDPEYRAKQAEYLRDYRAQYRAGLNAAARRHYKENRERRLAWQGEYHERVRQPRREAAKAQRPDEGEAA